MHVVTSQVPVDTPIGEVFTIIRTSRGVYRRHDGVEKGFVVRIVRSGRKTKKVLAEGEVLSHAERFVSFREVPDELIRTGYFEPARTRSSLFECMSKMYARFTDETPVIVITCRRTE